MSLLASEKLPNVNKERWEVSLRSIPRRMGRLTEADPEDERRQTIEKMFTGICSQYQEVLTAKQPTKYITGDQSKYGKGKPQRINPSWQRWHATQKQTGDFAAATETVMFGQREGLSCRVNGQTRDYSLLEADPKAQRLATSIELGFTASDVVLLYKPGVIELVHRELIPGTTEQLDKRLLVVEKRSGGEQEQLEAKFMLAGEGSGWRKLISICPKGIFGSLIHALFWSQTTPVVTST